MHYTKHQKQERANTFQKCSLYKHYCIICGKSWVDSNIAGRKHCSVICAKNFMTNKGE